MTEGLRPIRPNPLRLPFTPTPTRCRQIQPLRYPTTRKKDYSRLYSITIVELFACFLADNSSNCPISISSHDAFSWLDMRVAVFHSIACRKKRLPDVSC